mgnify:CR=1 FL=1
MNRNSSLFYQCSIIQLRQLVLHGQLSIYEVTKPLAATDFHFAGHPLITTEGLRLGTQAVPFIDPVIKDHMRPWSAEIRGGPAALFEATQELNLNRSGEILLEGHTFDSLPMKHQPIVPPSPSWPSTHLISYETIDGANLVMGELRFVKEVAKNAVELLPLIIAHSQEPIHNPKGVLIILSGLVSHKLWSPSLKIFTIKQCFEPFRGNVLGNSSI